MLTALAVATVWLLERMPGTNPWLLAAAPAVVFWGVQNWDFLAIFPLVTAIVLHDRRHDAAGATALAIATAAKLFPLVVLPVVLAVRLAERRVRAALTVAGTFAAVWIALNLPAALRVSGGDVDLRSGWTYFFRFSHDRGPVDTLWNPAASVATVNRITAVLLVAGLAAIVAVAVRAVHRGEAVLAPTAAAALLWFFATTKLYSAQYALWIMLALALAAAPVWAASVFVATDVLFFITLWGGLPAIGDFPTDASDRHRRPGGPDHGDARASAGRRRLRGRRRRLSCANRGRCSGAVLPDSPIWGAKRDSLRAQVVRAVVRLLDPAQAGVGGRTALDGPVEIAPDTRFRGVGRRPWWPKPASGSMPGGYDPIAVAEPTSLWPRAARRSA